MLEGNLCILIATVFFGLNIPVVKLLIPRWMTAMDVTAFRMLGGCVLIWITSLFFRRERIQRRHWVNLITGGAVGLFSFIFLFNLSLHYSNPIDVAIIMTMPPAFVMLINILFRKRHPSFLEIAGVVVSFAGSFIVISLQHGGDKGSDMLLGDLLALASAMCYAFYLVITEEPSKTYRPTTMLRWVYLSAAIPSVFLIPGLCHAGIWHTSLAQPWLMIAFVVVCVSYGSYFLMAPAEKKLSSDLVSIYQYLVPVVASVASVILGLDRIRWIQVLAMVVIIGGMVMSNIGKYRKGKQTPAAGTK